MFPEDSLRESQLRAAEAARSVTGAFGGRLCGLPGTHLAAVESPVSARRFPRFPRRPWHYWWQAHYLDLLVDAGLRGDAAAPGDAGRLVRSIRLRNGLRYTNWFFDDMAWLALAIGRLDALAAVRPTEPETGRRATIRAAGLLPERFGPHRRFTAALARALRSAHTPELGGGIYWTRKRDFKNAPATGPAALFFARTGERERAQELINWLNRTLLDPESGLYLDGLKAPVRRRGGPEAPRLERAVYTYNQGPALGALLELGGAENLDRAAALTTAVAERLTHPGGSVLLTHGTGDAGLFTGILCRYLAQAAATPALPPEQRRTAAALVSATANALWEGRTKRGGGTVFSPHPLEPAEAHYPAGAAVGLSTQLQAWMILEAAVRVQREFS